MLLAVFAEKLQGGFCRMPGIGLVRLGFDIQNPILDTWWEWWIQYKRSDGQFLMTCTYPNCD